MGAVWLGNDTVLGREVALKQLTPVTAGGPTAARAEREARLAARLSHPNVVAVFDLVDERGEQWLVMEYVEGTTLARLVAARGPLPLDDAAGILGEVADGLRAAHAAGVVHRDVKPSNILVGTDGHAKLTDFGVARGTDGESTLTQTGVVTGSPAYLSPEVAAGHAATPASDAWSLGATLFHAVEGRPPYEVGDNVLGTLYRIVNEEPPHSDRAGWLAPVLEHTMTREPGRRWSMSQIHDFLARRPVVETARIAVPAGSPGPPAEPAPSAQSTPAGRPPTAPPGHPPAEIAPEPGVRRPRRASRGRARRRLLLPAAACAVLLVAVVAGLLALQGRDEPTSRTATPPASAHASPGSATDSADDAAPTAEGVRSFVTSYLQTAASDAPAGFRMLTSAFQDESGGLSGYEGFWGHVARIDAIDRVTPELDGDDPKVSYRYTYTMDDGSTHTDDVHLRLVFTHGRYLIDGD